jgi:hypothetical protein
LVRIVRQIEAVIRRHEEQSLPDPRALERRGLEHRATAFALGERGVPMRCVQRKAQKRQRRRPGPEPELDQRQRQQAVLQR